MRTLLTCSPQGNPHNDMNANGVEHSSESHHHAGVSQNISAENTFVSVGSPGRSSHVDSSTSPQNELQGQTGDQRSDAADIPTDALAPGSLSVSHSSEIVSVPVIAFLSFIFPHYNTFDSADKPANLLEHTETQVSQLTQQSTIKTLSSEPTLLDIEGQEATQPSDSLFFSNGHEPTQIIDALEAEHFPEPPESPAISNLNEGSPSVPTKQDKPDKNLSANRLSISYNRSNRRLVINASSVTTLKLFRQEGRIEVVIAAPIEEDGGLKGILVIILSFFRYPLLTLLAGRGVIRSHKVLSAFDTHRLGN